MTDESKWSASVEAAIAAERRRIEGAIYRILGECERMDEDGPEVDTAEKALAVRIIMAVRGLETKP